MTCAYSNPTGNNTGGAESAVYDCLVLQAMPGSFCIALRLVKRSAFCAPMTDCYIRTVAVSALRLSCHSREKKQFDIDAQNVFQLTYLWTDTI